MTPPQVVARGWPLAGGFRGVGDAAPYGLPGNGRRREVTPHPALRGHLPPRGKAGVVGEGFIPPGVLAAARTPSGRRGRRPLRFALERAAAEGCGGVRAPRPTDGDMETLRGLRGHPFPGRRTVGAGHARPGGWCGHPSMVRPVGRGLDPSAGGYPGDGRWREVSGASGTPPPTGCPGTGSNGRLRRGEGTPPYGWGYGNVRGGVRGHPFPGRRTVGAGHARPGGWCGHPSMVRPVGRGLDPSAGGCPGTGGGGRSPLIRPCGATFPQGGRQGL